MPFLLTFSLVLNEKTTFIRLNLPILSNRNNGTIAHSRVARSAEPMILELKKMAFIGNNTEGGKIFELGCFRF